MERYLGLEEAREQAAAGWTRVASLQDFVSKPIKAVILDDGKAICVYKVRVQARWHNQVKCSLVPRVRPGGETLIAVTLCCSLRI